jgi:hypothetical protein
MYKFGIYLALLFLIGDIYAKDIPGFVHIEDGGILAAQGKKVPFINIFTVEGLIAYEKTIAKQTFRQYNPSNVNLNPHIHILAQGYVGKNITSGCESITRIVLLSDEAGSVVREAYWSESEPVTYLNNFNAKMQCNVLRAKFDMEDVRYVRESAKDGEFYVAVFSGTINNKTYKIKHKHQNKLDLK